MASQHHYWCLLFSGSALSWMLYCLYRNKRLDRKIQLRKRPLVKSNVNIGDIFGIDIGGTLTKLVYFEADLNALNNGEAVEPEKNPLSSPRRIRKKKSFVNLEAPEQKAALQRLYDYMDSDKTQKSIRDRNLTIYSSILGGKIHFLHFETRNMLELIEYLSSTAITEHVKTLGCTGGGAHKYSSQFADILEIKVEQLDELDCLLKGMDFAITNGTDECYTYRKSDQPSEWKNDQKDYQHVAIFPNEMFISSDIFPYLVVNIGSGVSILKVSSPGHYERVSGSSLGGGTYWGLCRLLTHCETYEQVLDLAEAGDANKVDMLVKDIYGGDYDGIKLSGSMVASSFGKLVMKEDPLSGVAEEDLALALLMMISNNIGQVAYLNAQLHNCTKIFFVGSFLRHNPISCKRLSFAIDFWSKGKMEALFLRHEGYFGALGTFLQSAFDSEVESILNLGHQEEVNKSSMIKIKAESPSRINHLVEDEKGDDLSIDSFELDNYEFDVKTPKDISESGPRLSSKSWEAMQFQPWIKSTNESPLSFYDLRSSSIDSVTMKSKAFFPEDVSPSSSSQSAFLRKRRGMSQ